jgi:cellulose biosynthesis protein BcsQ
MVPRMAPNRRCRRYAAANNKGGVGKSTLICRLAEELAARGHRVLVGDGDPQGNVSRMLGHNEEALLQRPTINEVVLAARPGCAADAILPCAWDQLDDMPDEVYELAQRIDLLPARFDYELRLGEAAGHEPGSAMARHARQRLAVALGGGVLDQYDFFLMDLPPSIGPLTHMGLDAISDVEDEAEAGGVIIPLYPDYDPISGAVRMRDLVTAGARDWERPFLRTAGVVINRFDPSRKKSQERDYLPFAKETFAGQLIGPVFHERAPIAEVGSLGYPLRSQPNWRIRDNVKEFGQVVEVMEKGRVAA